MATCAILLAVYLAGSPQIEPAHARNIVFKQALDEGLKDGGQTVTLPRPGLRDGQGAEAERAVLRKAAGSDQAVENMLRNSTTAPYIIKVHDVKTADATIRLADLWFVVYADLRAVDPAKEAGRTDQKEVGAANMDFQTRLLKVGDLRAAGITPPTREPGLETWYARVHGRLLDRIDFQVTNQVTASQSSESLVVAARSDPTFAKPGPNQSGWKPLPAPGTSQGEGALQPYAGGISYAKISRLALKPGALLVELHVAFVEPNGWFRGAPILRSKFSVVAQDQIRRLRRELAKKRGK
jgi:hypothetical protein